MCVCVCMYIYIYLDTLYSKKCSDSCQNHSKDPSVPQNRYMYWPQKKETLNL